jgi:hypothetical protein
MTVRYFVFLEPGAVFDCNGNRYVKQSTRTSRMLSNGRVFYFRSGELVGAL